eukprot:2892041-Lingulodinium_polyedra.AAC.1
MALHDLARRPGAHGEVVRMVNGHVVNFGLLSRCILAVPSHLFRFAVRNLGRWARWTAHEVAELRCLAGLL